MPRTRKSIVDHARGVDAARAEAKTCVLRERFGRYLDRPSGFEQDCKEFHELTRCPDETDDALQSTILGILQAFEGRTVRASHLQRPALVEGVLRQLRAAHASNQEFYRVARGYAARLQKVVEKEPEEDEQDRKERRLRALAEAVGELSQEDRELLHLRFQCRFTVPAIAIRFEMTKGQVTHWLRQTKRVLRERIECLMIGYQSKMEKGPSAVSRIISQQFPRTFDPLYIEGTRKTPFSRSEPHHAARFFFTIASTNVPFIQTNAPWHAHAGAGR